MVARSIDVACDRIGYEVSWQETRRPSMLSWLTLSVRACRNSERNGERRAFSV
jgi:hypothetical protein